MLLVNGFSPKHINSILIVEWYVSDLFIFYCLAPLIKRIVGNLRQSLAFLIICIIISVLFHYLTDGLSEYKDYYSTLSVLVQMPVIAIGIVLYYLCCGNVTISLKQYTVVSLVFAFAGGCLFSIFYFFGCISKSLLAGLVFGWICYSFAFVEKKGCVINLRLLTLLGKYSLGIYLFHMFIIKLLGVGSISSVINNSLTGWFLVFVMTLTLSTVISYYTNILSTGKGYIKMSTGRVQWIDDCKGLAILLVILGHTMRTDLSLVYIYGFHMPLFFFLSGLVCNEKKYTWGSFLKSRFNTLVIPYIAFYLLTWLYWLFVERSFRPLGMEWWQPLIGMVYGAQWHEYMSHNGILWFLPCLFVAELLFFSVKKLPRTWIQLLVVIVLAGVGYLFKTNLPWCINIACVALQFFFVGNILRTELLKKDETKRDKSMTVIVSLVATTAYILLSAHWLNHVNMATNAYGNIAVFELLAFVGICGFVCVCKWLNFSRIGGGQLGRNTLVIFALHQPILRIVRFLGEKILPSFPVETNLLYALAADTIVVLCLIPLIWLYNKYGLPVLKKIYI